MRKPRKEIPPVQIQFEADRLAELFIAHNAKATQLVKEFDPDILRKRCLSRPAAMAVVIDEETGLKSHEYYDWWSSQSTLAHRATQLPEQPTDSDLCNLGYAVPVHKNHKSLDQTLLSLGAIDESTAAHIAHRLTTATELFATKRIEGLVSRQCTVLGTALLVHAGRYPEAIRLSFQHNAWARSGGTHNDLHSSLLLTDWAFRKLPPDVDFDLSNAASFGSHMSSWPFDANDYHRWRELRRRVDELLATLSATDPIVALNMHSNQRRELVHRSRLGLVDWHEVEDLSCAFQSQLKLPNLAEHVQVENRAAICTAPFDEKDRMDLIDEFLRQLPGPLCSGAMRLKFEWLQPEFRFLRGETSLTDAMEMQRIVNERAYYHSMAFPRFWPRGLPGIGALRHTDTLDEHEEWSSTLFRRMTTRASARRDCRRVFFQ